jgi:hypothetical protein
MKYEKTKYKLTLSNGTVIQGTDHNDVYQQLLKEVLVGAKYSHEDREAMLDMAVELIWE